MVKIMSILLPTKVIGRFHVAVQPGDVQKWVSPDAIPVAFGGEKIVEDADIPETGCNAPKELTKEDFRVGNSKIDESCGFAERWPNLGTLRH